MTLISIVWVSASTLLECHGLRLGWKGWLGCYCIFLWNERGSSSSSSMRYGVAFIFSPILSLSLSLFFCSLLISWTFLSHHLLDVFFSLDSLPAEQSNLLSIRFPIQMISSRRFTPFIPFLFFPLLLLLHHLVYSAAWSVAWCVCVCEYFFLLFYSFPPFGSASALLMPPIYPLGAEGGESEGVT